MIMEAFFDYWQEYLILILFGALFFKETLTSFVNAKLGIEDKPPSWANKLSLYFNHDTTDHHKRTHEKLDKLILMEEKQDEHADEMRDTMRGIDSSLKEIKEYGVKIRK